MNEPPPNAPTPGSLTQRTFDGLRWTYIQSGVSAVLQLGMAAVLARLLSPAAFGLLALANLVLRFVEYFAQAGVSQAVVQKLELTKTDIRAAFTLSTGLSVVFLATAWVAAPWAGTVFAEPDLTPVLRAMSFALLISGLGAPAVGILRRHMRFKVLAVKTIGTYLFGYGVVGLPLALSGAGVWSLVGATLTQSLTSAVVAYLLVRHPLLPTRSMEAYRAIFAFGGRVSIVGFFEFLGNELPTLAIGRFAGVSDLGLYNRGYILVKLPLYQLKSGLSKVLFPALSSIQTDLPRLRSTYLTATAGAAAVGLPVCVGIAVASRELILVVYGSQWIDAAAVVPWLALAVANSLVGHFGGVMAEAQGALNAKLVIVVSKVGLLAALLLMAVGHPIWAFGAALALASIYGQVGYLVVMSRSLQLPLTEIVKVLMPALLASGMVGASQAAARWPLATAGAPDAVSLLVQVVTAAVTLAAAFRVGPLRRTAREMSRRLEHVGMLDPSHPQAARRALARAIRFILG